MEKILLITEKYSITFNFLKQAYLAKDKRILDAEIFVAHSNPGSAPVYNYPTDIKYKDYPKYNPLKLKWNSEFEKMNNRDFDLKLHFNNISQMYLKKDFEQEFDTLIVMQDPDYVGAYYALSTLELLYGTEYEKKFNEVIYSHYFVISDLHSTLYNHLEEKRNFFFKLARGGKTKKEFQFNFNFNSFIFFSELLKHLNIKSEIKLSKYMVHMLHILYNEKYSKKFLNLGDIDIIENGVNQYKLLIMMKQYKGSGKVNERLRSCFLIGSPATTSTIIDNLLHMGLIKEKSNTIYRTNLGSKLFDLLNKKTFDIDMPFRILDWQKEAENKKDVTDQIEKYIYNYFIGQKRKNKFLKKMD